ncbi:MAG: cupredoxin domain-containing protein [Candidatus Poseidoniales archaeon]
MRAVILVGILIISILIPLPGELIANTESKSVQQGNNTTIITVDSTNLRFSPSSVTIEEGDTVRFFWSGQALPHNAVENNGLFDSGEPNRDVDYLFTFEKGMNGTYDFVCEPHAAFGMVGSITVEPAPPVAGENNSTGDINKQAKDATLEPNTFGQAIWAIAVISLAVFVIYLLQAKRTPSSSNTDKE